MTLFEQIKTIGVIGAGQMRSGIAQVFAQSGFQVILNDASEEALTRASSALKKSLDCLVSKEKISTQEQLDTLERLTMTA